VSDLFLGLGLVIVGMGLCVWIKQWITRRRSLSLDQFYERVEQLTDDDKKDLGARSSRR